MEFYLVDTSKQLPSHLRPSRHYAQIAASFRKHGLNVRDNEYELIDALCDGTLPRPHPRYFGGKKREKLLTASY